MNRRGFLRGAGSLLAVPAIVRIGSLMPVALWKPVPTSLPLTHDVKEWGHYEIGNQLHWLPPGSRIVLNKVAVSIDGKFVPGDQVIVTGWEQKPCDILRDPRGSWRPQFRLTSKPGWV